MILFCLNKTHVKNTVGEYYAINHSRQDFDVLEEVIKEFYSEYEDSFHYLMYSSNSYSPCNMMICRKELFDDYCEWLFWGIEKSGRTCTYSILYSLSSSNFWIYVRTFA